MKGKIVEKKTALITIEGDQGKVNVSLHKHGLLFLKLSNAKVGDEVDVPTEKSDASSTYIDSNGVPRQASGNLYVTQTNKVSQSLIDAKKLLLQEANLTKAIEGL
jgi:hypothetical protein